MPDSPIPERLLSQLLWRHLTWHLGVGLTIWTGMVIPYNLIAYLQKRQSILHSDFYAQLSASSTTSAIDNLISQYALTAAYALLFGLIAATISALIRYPVLTYLASRARTRRELVWKSLLLFGISVVLLSLIPWPVAYNRFSVEMIGFQLRALFIFTLPWLMATWLASRKLAAALALPDKAN